MRGRGLVVGLVLLAVALLLLWLVRGILMPFAVSIAIAAVLDPFLARLQRRGMSRTASVLVVYLLFFLAFGAFLTWAVPVLVGEANQLIEQWPGYVDKFRGFWAGFVQNELLRHLGVTLPASWSELSENLNDAIKTSGPGYFAKFLGGVFGTIGYLLNVVIILIATYYLLKDWPVIRRRVHYVIPPQYREGVVELIERVGAVFLGYLRGMVTLCCMYGVAVTLALLILDLFPGVETSYQFILGLAGAFLYAVPYVGAALLAVVAAIVTLVGSGGTPLNALLVTVVVLALNSALFDPVLTPKVLGRSTGLSPLLALFAIIAGSKLFGFAGFILGVPVTASLAIIACALYPRLGAPIPENADVPPAEPLPHGPAEESAGDAADGKG